MYDTFTDWADVFKALADKTRLHILALLKEHEWCVCELVEVLDATQPAISQHLRKLRMAGLIKERKAAQWVYYRLDEDKIPFLHACIAVLPDVSEEWARMEQGGLHVSCTTGADLRRKV